MLDPSSTLDPNMLAQLRELDVVRPGFLAQMSSSFLEHAERRVQVIEQPSAALPAVADAAHALKGSSATIGARGLSSIAAAIEADARSGRGPGSKAADLRAAFEAIRPAIDGLS